MAVSKDDVLMVAGLARIAVPPERLTPLIAELNSILGHMEALAAVDTSGVEPHAGTQDAMRLSADVGPAVPLGSPPSSMAPQWRDGFFLVPRLATHGDAGALAADDDEGA